MPKKIDLSVLVNEDLVSATHELMANILVYYQQYIDYYPTALSQPVILIGIETGGALLSDYLYPKLKEKLPTLEYGTIDISYYRDDFDEKGLKHSIKANVLPETIDDKIVILIDDILMTGRTVRAAMNTLFDYGRPQAILLAALAVIGIPELPVTPNVSIYQLPQSSAGRIKLTAANPFQFCIKDM